MKTAIISNKDVGLINPITLLDNAILNLKETIDTLINGVVTDDVKSFYDIKRIETIHKASKVKHLTKESNDILLNIFKQAAVEYMKTITDAVIDIDSKITEQVNLLDIRINDVEATVQTAKKIVKDPALKEYIETVGLAMLKDSNMELKEFNCEHLGDTMDPKVLSNVLELPKSISNAVKTISDIRIKDEKVAQIAIDSLSDFYKEKSDLVIEAVNALSIGNKLPNEYETVIKTLEANAVVYETLESKLEESVEMINSMDRIDIVSIIKTYSVDAIMQLQLNERSIDLKNLNNTLLLLLNIKRLEATVYNKVISVFKETADEYNVHTGLYITIVNKADL